MRKIQLDTTHRRGSWKQEISFLTCNLVILITGGRGLSRVQGGEEKNVCFLFAKEIRM